MQQYKDLEQLSMIKAMLLEGRTLNEIGIWCGLSRERIRQIRLRWLPELEDITYGKAVITSEKKKARLEHIQNTYGRDSWKCTEIERAQSHYFVRKRQNAKATKWEFTVTFNDVDWLTHCPILGLELDWFADNRQENSPSLDRINTSLGYIPGNVQIISWRANRIKNDGTSEEHRKIAEYIDKHVKIDT